jgi:hypothetical protein
MAQWAQRRHEARALPPPLPPERRTVGQLVAESIRLYGRRFWATLALGLGPAGLAIAGSFLDRTDEVLLTAAGGAVVLGACYTLACALVAGQTPPRQVLFSAWLTAIAVWIPVPFLAFVFVVPAIAWLALVGLAVPAAVIERLSIRQAISRGIQLGRVDYVHSVGSLAAVTIVVFLTQSVLYFLLRSGSEQAARVSLFLANLVISPLLFVGAALLYEDQAARIRVQSGSRTERSRDADVPDALDPDRPGPPHAAVESRPAARGQP